MKLTLQLAHLAVCLDFIGALEAVVPFYTHLYRKFLIPAQGTDARIRIRLTGADFSGLSVGKEPLGPDAETPVPRDRFLDGVGRWLENTDELSVDSQTITARLLNGLSVYCPEKRQGCILLSDRDRRPNRPIYHLIWLLLAQILGDDGGCFIHSAGLEIDDGGYLFLGESGAGKSTVAALCPKSRVLSDESPILFEREGFARIFPSPFHQLQAGQGPEPFPRGAPLKGVYFLIRDRRAFLEPVSPQAAFSMALTRHVHYFQFLSEPARVKLFDLFYDICHRISVAYLHFSRDTDILSVITGEGEHAESNG